MAARARLVLQVAAVLVVLLLLALLTAEVVAQGRVRSLADRLEAGETPAAPDFDVRRLNGDGSVSLASLRGKAVVVNFWASWCDPCEDESPYLEALWRDRRGDGLVLVGVNEEDVSKDARRFARRQGLTYPLVRDRSGELRDDYKLRGYPETFVLDRRGRIAALVRGPVTDEFLAREVPPLLREDA